MNERLEKEIQEWIPSHVKAPKDSIHAPAVIEWGEIVAKHFYNFALHDIKKSVEISKGNAKTYENIANQQESFSEFIKYAHQIPVYEEIIKLIDSLMEESKS